MGGGLEVKWGHGSSFLFFLKKMGWHCHSVLDVIIDIC